MGTEGQLSDPPGICGPPVSVDPHWSLWTPLERFLRAESSTLGRRRSSQVSRVSTETRGPASSPGAPTSPQGLPQLQTQAPSSQERQQLLMGDGKSPTSSYPAFIPSCCQRPPVGQGFFPLGAKHPQTGHTAKGKTLPQQGCRTEAGVAWPGSGRRGWGLPHGVRLPQARDPGSAADQLGPAPRWPPRPWGPGGISLGSARLALWSATMTFQCHSWVAYCGGES